MVSLRNGGVTCAVIVMEVGLLVVVYLEEEEDEDGLLLTASLFPLYGAAVVEVLLEDEA